MGGCNRRVGRRVAAGVVVAVLAGLLPSGPPAGALTLTVNSTADAVDATPGDGTCAATGGACTLRAAVMEANASAGADTITVPAGTYRLTLGPTDNDGLNTAAAEGSGDLDVKDDLVVSGAGAGSTTIDGEGLDRVFDVGYGNDGSTTGEGIDLTVQNVTIVDGSAKEDTDPPDFTKGNNDVFGGAIRYDGFDTAAPSSPGSLTITNVVFTANAADWSGGAVFVRFGDVTITGSTFAGNVIRVAGDGGAVAYGNSQPNGDLVIAGSTFSGNRAVEGIAYGGAFGHIAAGGRGGAVMAENGPGVTITNSSFTGNEAEHDGGAVFTNNKAFSLSGSTVHGNKAGRHGGGVYSDADVSIDPAATTTITSSTISGNTADATVASVVASDGTGNGGGIFHTGGKLALSSSTIGGTGAGNTARNGGGIAFDDVTTRITHSSSDVRKNQIVANTAAVAGGGVWVAKATFTATLNRFRANSAPTGRGLARTDGAAAVTRNWWGCNEDPATGGAGCDTVSGSSVTTSPRLVLTHTASPATIRVGETSTLTASVLVDSAGGAVPAADVTVLVGLPLAFGNAVRGTLSGAGTSVGAGGTATATYTAGSTGGPGSADAAVDSAVATAVITVQEPPTLTVPADITTTEDPAGSGTASVSWTTSATGYPTPTTTCAVGGTTVTSPHSFPVGTTTVTCTATNGVSPDDVESFDVTVEPANHTPVADAGGPYAVDEGASIVLDGTGSSDSDGDPLTLAWDLDDDGTFETPGPTPTFDAGGIDGPATRNVSLRATDNEGASHVDGATVTVANVAPTASATVPDATEGSAVTGTFAAADPAPADQAAPFTFSVSWGDGSTDEVVTSTSPLTLSHVYAAAGSYTVTVTASDDDGGVSAPASTPVEVAAVPPPDDGTPPDEGLPPGSGGGGGGGYLLAATDGGVFALGGAVFHGSLGGVRLAAPIVGMARTPSGDGYWLVGADGGVFAFGDAGFHGSLGGVRLAAPIVGMAATNSGEGYWLVGADGGVFAFGDALFRGSLARLRLARPIVGMAADDDGSGYWLVGADGGVFAFGGARFRGSLGGVRLAAPVTGMAANPGGPGYWLVARDGGVFAFGGAPFGGSLARVRLQAPVVGQAA